MISDLNTCTGVRVFDCQNEKQIVSDEEVTTELMDTSRKFLPYCLPEITETNTSYMVDYSVCHLKVEMSKENPWVKNVEVEGNLLSREQINSHFE